MTESEFTGTETSTAVDPQSPPQDHRPSANDEPADRAAKPPQRRVVAIDIPREPAGDQRCTATKAVATEVDVPPAKSAAPPGADEEPDADDDRAAGPRIIALMNQKGGVGKTTTAVNVGAALARAGKQVLMVDLDPQAHLTLHLGLDPESLELTLYDLLTDRDTTAGQVVQRGPGEAGANIGVLPADVNLAGVEAELADRVVTGAAQSVLRSKCAGLAANFDYVLIDCPPSLGLLTINALTLAREVIVPMQAHFLALQGLSKLLETITMVRQGVNPELMVSGIVLCMHEKQTILAGEVISDLSGFLEEARGTDLPWAEAVIYQPPVRRNIKLAESPSFGQSIFEYDSDCHGAADYRRLAESIAAHRVSAVGATS